MGLLYKRPLALFCTCFLAALYASSYLIPQRKLVLLFAFLAIAVILVGFALCNKKRRLLWITLILCAAAIALAFLHMYVRIDRREEKALKYTGYRTVECQVLSKVWEGSGHSEYIAELLCVSDDDVRIRTYLICGFWGDLHEGDRFVARVELLETDQLTYGIRADERVNDSRVLLTTVLYDENDGTLTFCGKDRNAISLLSQPNGIELLSDRMQQMTANLFDRLLGEEISPLARSFFIGDKSDLSARTVRDFRRTGTSHLLAVSGLHIAVLLGGLEWILRKLTLSKILRIVSISTAALLLLIMTGFSMSACRSVLMLYAVYLHYLFAKENDGLTSLLVAVSLILLVSADAFFDLGLWMSFLATLGLLTVYPLLDAAIPRKRFRLWLANVGFRVVRGALMVALMSTVTSLFLLPIQWSVFGEISLVAIPANVALASLSTVFLCAIPITLLLAPIPWIGMLARYGLTALGRMMTTILDFFSKRNFAMLSLRYVFADIIIPILAMTMLLLLLVRLRHKWILAIPPILAAVCFTTCLLITYHKEPPIVTDYTNGNQRFLSVVERGEAVLCDLSCERSTAYFDAAKTLRAQGATDIDALVLGHLSENLPKMLEDFLPYTVVHRIYLSSELSETSPLVVEKIMAVVKDAGCEVTVYENETPFLVLKNTWGLVYTGSEESPAAVCFDCDGQNLTYADPSQMTSTKQKVYISQIGKSHTAWISVSECEGKATLPISVSSSTLKQIIVDQPHRDHACVSLETGEIPVYRYPNDRKKRIVSFSLEP